MAIAASSHSAVCKTSVVIECVPVIAIFHACPDETISANGEFAGGGACVIVLAVAVITGFHVGSQQAVAAAGSAAETGACVRVIPIAIIAFFVARVVGVETGSDDPVTAATDLALVRTIVCIVRVAIVADLLLGIEVAVATGPLSTRIGASIRIDLVAIITVFLRADHTISAPSRLAVGQALVAIGPVAVVTALVVGMF